MKRSTLVGSVAVCLFLGLSAPLFAAEVSAAGAPDQASSNDGVSASKPPAKCAGDLQDFNTQMQKDRFWLGYTAGDPGLEGYGYPLGGDDLGSYPSAGDRTGYVSARQGYEVRALLAAVDILARHGLEQPCEDVLAAARDHYKQYVADMERAGMPMANVPGWQRRQIAAAQPVTSVTTPFRSDQLIGASVRNLRNESLGTVDDLVTSPQTGSIAYAVIARGGIFGIGAKHVAVPWDDFKVSPNATLLVLAAAPKDLDDAPQASGDQLTKPGQGSRAVDAYWKTHIRSGGND